MWRKHIRLSNLLHFVEKFKEYQSKELMELMGMPFPPVFPQISPESDWHRFELWLAGKEVRKKLLDQLSIDFQILPPDKVSYENADLELQKLSAAINNAGFGISLNDGIPPKVVYQYIWDTLQEVFEISSTSGGGGWFIDGCSGYCPGCFQRPWCETGLTGYWPEDKKAGKMELPEEIKEYVSASSVSLDILKEYEDPEEEYMVERNQDSGYVPDVLNRGLGIPREDFDDLDQEESEDDLPF